MDTALKIRMDKLITWKRRYDLVFPIYFWRKVDVKEIGKCWEWMGTKSTNGYGTVKRLKNTISTHRMAYELVHGPIPDGLFVCHHCDNKPCCNPFHLFLGTNSDNQQDCIAKGRKAIFKGKENPMYGVCGEDHPVATFTNAQVRKIREQYASGAYTQSALAAIYKTTQASISQITRCVIYKHA